MNKTRLLGLSFDPKEALLVVSVLVGIACWFVALWPVALILAADLAVLLVADTPPKQEITDRTTSKLSLAVSAVVFTTQIGPLAWLVRFLIERMHS